MNSEDKRLEQDLTGPETDLDQELDVDLMGVDPVYGDQDLEVDELPDHVKVFNRSKFSAQVDLSKFTLASAEDKEQHIQMRPPSTFLKDGMAKFRKNKLAMASAIILIFIIVMIIIAPLLVPYSYSDIVTVNGRRDKTARTYRRSIILS